MHVRNDLWWRQCYESMKEASRLYQRFKGADEPDIDDLDKAMELYNCINSAYELRHTSFEEFIELGTSLRARQALTNITKA